MTGRAQRWAAGLLCLACLWGPATAAARGTSSVELRRSARSILSEKRFQPAKLPRPLHGLLERVGDAFRPVGRFFASVYRKLLSVTPGGEAVLWPLLAVVVLGAAAAITATSVRRRTRAEQTSDRKRALAELGDDPVELDRRAAAAERDGDLGMALRLRFRAGLVRLDSHEAIRLRPSLTTGEVTQRLGSPTFAALAGDFEEVAYGGRPATDADVERARSDWPRVLTETR